MKIRLGISGASAALGSGATAVDKSWADRLARYLRVLDPTMEMFNSSVVGATTTSMSVNFKQVCEKFSPKSNEEFRIMIIQVPGQDLAFGPQHEYRVDPETFQSNLEAMLTLAQDAADLILVQGIIPVRELLQPRTLYWKTNKNVQLYNTLVSEVCGNRSKVVFINAHAAFLGRESELLSEDDGIHPNDAGHDVIFGLMVGVIDQFIKAH